MAIDEQIKAVEDEIQKTPYNKATQHHIGRLKAKLARLKDEQETRRLKSGGGGPSYAVRKSGNATVGLVGFPSVGKSTLLNQITDATSAVAAYDFTTLDVIPGLMEHRGAKIQVLDMPGLIRGASKGRGRGKEVLSVARACDLILLMIDVFETHVDDLAVHAGLPQAAGEGGGHGGSHDREAGFRRRYGVRRDPPGLAEAVPIRERVGAVRTVPRSEGRPRSSAQRFRRPHDRAAERVTGCGPSSPEARDSSVARSWTSSWRTAGRSLSSRGIRPGRRTSRRAGRASSREM